MSAVAQLATTFVKASLLAGSYFMLSCEQGRRHKAVASLPHSKWGCTTQRACQKNEKLRVIICPPFLVTTVMETTKVGATLGINGSSREPAVHYLLFKMSRRIFQY